MEEASPHVQQNPHCPVLVSACTAHSAVPDGARLSWVLLHFRSCVARGGSLWTVRGQEGAEGTMLWPYPQVFFCFLLSLLRGLQCLGLLGKTPRLARIAIKGSVKIIHI